MFFSSHQVELSRRIQRFCNIARNTFMVPSLAISRNAPLPLSHSSSFFLSSISCSTFPFFPPPTFAFLFSLRLSFFLFRFPLLSPLRSFCPVREHLEKRKKRLDTRRHRGGVRGFDSTRGIQFPSPILPPVARTAPAEKRFRFIKSGGRATPSKNDRLWDGQRLCFPFQILF